MTTNERDLTDAERCGMAIGCPAHGPKSMDYDDDGVFCTTCDRNATIAARIAADQPCHRCGAYCSDRDDCDLALDGVSPALWRNPERNAS